MLLGGCFMLFFSVKNSICIYEIEVDFMCYFEYYVVVKGTSYGNLFRCKKFYYRAY